jgi:hypothetical protein
VRLVKKGDRVLQPNYGTGTVTDVNDEHTVIDFDEHGIRKFVTNLVSLSLTERPAPDRPARRRGRKKPPTPAAP